MYKILYIGRPIESIVQVLKESASLDLLGYILDKNLPENKRVCQELCVKKFSPELQGWLYNEIEQLIKNKNP